jgi:hypothetical protein
MKRWPLCLLVLRLSLAPAGAQEFTGIKLYQFCSDPNPSSAASLGCSAYVAGFMEGLFIGKSLPGSGHSFCPPKGLTVPQGRLVIEKFMRDRPKILNEAASSISMAALVLAFPCDATKSN